MNIVTPSTSRVGINATRMARSGEGTRPGDWTSVDDSDGTVGVHSGVSGACMGVGLDITIGVVVGTGVGILSRGRMSSRVRYITKSRRFGSAGPSVKVRTNWLPARTTGRVK